MITDSFKSEGFSRQDCINAGLFTKTVYGYLNIKGMPERFGQNMGRLRKLHIASKGNKDMLLEGIAGEFSGDIRIFLEHMNPVQNYFLAVRDDVDQEKLGKTLKRFRKGRYKNLSLADTLK